MINKLAKIKCFIPITILLIISGIVIFSWFKSGYFFGGGEESLSTWNSAKMMATYHSPWIDMGLGYPNPFWLPRLPVYYLTYFLSYFSSPSTVQGILFWILTSTAGVGMYFLAKYFFGTGRYGNFAATFAGLFYILNLYTQSQVWARFIFAGFFVWASMPLMLYLWIQWNEFGKLKYLLLFTLFSILFSSTYSHPAFIFSFWLLALLFSFLKIISKSVKVDLKKIYLMRILLGFLGWTLGNIWWIYPYYRLQSSIVLNLYDWKYDFATLTGVSADSKILDVLFLRHKYFFERLDYWGNFYNSKFSYLINYAVLAVSFVGLVKARILKEYKFLLTLGVIAFFMCKGTNPPFGSVFFKFLFEYFPLARVFRSSYEKFGVVWLMVYSIFFAYGFTYIYQKASRIWKFIWAGVLIPLFLIVLVWPMWKIGPFSPQARVAVPDDYNTADAYLNSLNQEGRMLSLPVIPGEGVRYDWGPTSYYGLEPSDILFTNPVVSKTVRYKYADDKFMEIYDSFVHKKDIDKLLSETNIEYLLLHNELIPSYSNASTSSEVKETLKSYPSIKFLKSFGKLDIYKNTKFLSNNLITTDGDILYTYRRLNPGHYKVDVSYVKSPFKLILKTSFSPLWVANIEKESVSDHFVALDYANGWEINKTGSYSINLVFKVWPEFLSGTD